MPRKPQTKSKKNTKPRTVRYSVDCSHPVDDGIMDPNAFVKGKAGNLGDSVKISKDKAVVTVTATVPLSKRYIKYLTKKFLKKQQLKDYLQVISSSKSGYLVKYYDINQGADEEAAEE